MSRHGKDFDRAQAAYDAQTPYDNDPPMMECPNCDGTGEIKDMDNLEQSYRDDYVECAACKGEGEVPQSVNKGKEPED